MADFFSIMAGDAEEYSLRDYQAVASETCVDLVSDGCHQLMFVMAPGLGKTLVFSNITKYFPEHAEYGKLVLVHRDELVFQAAEKILKLNPQAKIGIEKAQYRADPDCDFVIASVQTLGRRNNSRINKFIKRCAIITTDECHHVTRGGMYDYVLSRFGVGSKAHPDHVPLPNGLQRISLGFTATPNRHDGRGLDRFYQKAVCNYSIHWGRENGWLVPVIPYISPTAVNITGVKTRAGDFAEGDLGKVINVNRRNAVIVGAYKKYSNGQAIAYCAGREHAHELAHAFILSGVPAAAVDYKTDSNLRSVISNGFRTGTINVVCNCNIYTEGTDFPFADTVIMAKPTQSQGAYIQMAGRVFRPYGCYLEDLDILQRIEAIADSTKPHCLLLDFADVYNSHSEVMNPVLAGIDIPLEKKRRSIRRNDETITHGKYKDGDLLTLDFMTNRSEANTLEELDVDMRLADEEREFEVPDYIAAVSKFLWKRTGPSTYNIRIARKDRDITMQIDGDEFNQWRLTFIQHSTFSDKKVNGRRELIPEEITKVNKPVQGLEVAIKKVDGWIRAREAEIRDFGVLLREDEKKKYRRKRGKSNKRATPAMINRIRHTIGIDVPNDLAYNNALHIIIAHKKATV